MIPSNNFRSGNFPLNRTSETQSFLKCGQNKVVYKLFQSSSASVCLSCSQYNIVVEDIMVRKVKFISIQSTYREVKLLLDSSSLKSIPLVDSKGERVKHKFNLSKKMQ